MQPRSHMMPPNSNSTKQHQHQHQQHQSFNRKINKKTNIFPHSAASISHTGQRMLTSNNHQASAIEPITVTPALTAANKNNTSVVDTIHQHVCLHQGAEITLIHGPAARVNLPTKRRDEQPRATYTAVAVVRTHLQAVIQF